MSLKDQFFKDKPNCEIDTNQFFPLYRYNPFQQGIGKGHYLAIKYLINHFGIK